MKKIRAKKYGIIILILMLATGFSAFAQEEYTKFSGKVVSLKKNKPLESVSLSVNETNIGTITNSEGDFILKVPKDLMDSKVVVSLLGYTTRVLPLSELTDGIEIELSQAVTQLSPISINAYKNAENLVRKVFAEKNKNLRNESVYMTAFYRETIKRRNRNVSLTEAVVNILKQPHSTALRDAIKLDKARKRTDYKKLDTVSVKLQGGPFSTIYLDIMKYPEYIFSDESITNYNFSFDSPSAINNRNVYVVNFESRKKIYNINYFGKLFIDVETLALVSADYALDLSDESRTRNLLVKRKPGNVVVQPLEANYHVDYKEKNGKWYYSYSNLNLEFKVKKKRRIFNKVYTLSSEMAVTDWEINTTVKRFKNRESLRPSVIITDAISGFADPDFWGESNLIEPDKSIESAIEKIKEGIEKQRERERKAAESNNGKP